MDENELWAVHDLYSQVAEYFDVDIEDTEYDEYGTYPNHVHKKVDDHKEAIRLLSGLLEQETELPITELESWQ